MSLRFDTLTIDANDPQAEGRWWAELLDWEWEADDDGDVVVTPRGGQHATPMLFQKVPEGKVVKNRLHWDLRPDDQDAEVERALSIGATRVDLGQSGDDRVTWVVLADPEGNELCILRAHP
jgi:predicted enzyme related to lactoylglutathione lyase